MKAAALAALLLAGCASAPAAPVTPPAPRKLVATADPMRLFEGGTMVVRCRLDRAPEDRILTLALADGVSAIESSTRQYTNLSTLNELWIKRTPCGSYVALCALVDATGKQTIATAPVEVLGRCNDGGSDK